MRVLLRWKRRLSAASEWPLIAVLIAICFLACVLFVCCLWLRSVGLVIGKKGVMVNKICKDTNTRLHINPPEWEAPEESLWVPIGVIGEPQNAQAAYEKIRDLVEGEEDGLEALRCTLCCCGC